MIFFFHQKNDTLLAILKIIDCVLHYFYHLLILSYKDAKLCNFVLCFLNACLAERITGKSQFYISFSHIVGNKKAYLISAFTKLDGILCSKKPNIQFLNTDTKTKYVPKHTAYLSASWVYVGLNRNVNHFTGWCSFSCNGSGSKNTFCVTFTYLPHAVYNLYFWSATLKTK